MPSQLELVIARFRAQLIAGDDATRQVILAVYDDIRARLAAEIDALATRIATGDLTAGELYRLDRYLAFEEQLDQEMARLGAATDQVTREAQRRMIALAGEQQRALAIAGSGSQALGARVAATWTRVPTDALQTLVGQLSNGSPLRAWADQFGPATSRAIRDALTEGIALGRGVDQIAAAITRETDLAAVRATMTARNSVMGAYRNGSLANYQENADILDGWYWTASHDATTCLACLALDGEFFPLEHGFFRSHLGCRCSPRPAVKGAPEFDVETGRTWFAAQPEAVQRRMIPASAWDDFQAGRMTLDDFVHLEPNAVWGDAFRQASVAQARASAAAGRSAAAIRIPGFSRAPRDVIEVPDESRAETRRMIERVKTTGVQEVRVLQPLPPPALDVIGRSYETLAGQGIVVPRRLEILDLREPNTIAQYRRSGDLLQVNAGERFWTDPVGEMGLLGSGEILVSTDPRAIILHEVGHAAQWRMVRHPFEDTSFIDRALTDQERAIAERVSTYAMAGSGEFVAEVFAGMVLGRSFDPQVMELYGALRGFGL